MCGPLVRAILDGAKTQTRRKVRLGRWQIEERDDGSPWPWMYDEKRDGDSWLRCPYGQPGDRLWVRETWRSYPDGIVYRADYRDTDFADAVHAPWRASIHMPRSASRIELEVTGVRVELLQDISEADAVAEGVERTVTGDGWRRYCNDEQQEAAGLTPCSSEIGSFKSLWESINGAGAWDLNPWVWVVSFVRVKP
jgi:hypothetical protein